VTGQPGASAVWKDWQGTLDAEPVVARQLDFGQSRLGLLALGLPRLDRVQEHIEGPVAGGHRVGEPLGLGIEVRDRAMRVVHSASREARSCSLSAFDFSSRSKFSGDSVLRSRYA